MTNVVGRLEGIFTFGLLDAPAGVLLSLLLSLLLLLLLLPQPASRATKRKETGNRRIAETLSGAM